MDSIYTRIGGAPAVSVVVDDFYDRVLSDDALADYFGHTDMVAQRKHLKAFVAVALGGPNEYQGRAIQRAHAGLGITEGAFNRVAGHLADALAAAGVDEPTVGDIISAVAGLQPEIVSA